MTYGFLDIASTPDVRAAQEANNSRKFWEELSITRKSDQFTPAEEAFIAKRDSFYMATMSESGWPYIQHRGGPPGFLRVLDPATLGFADFRGNRQYISVGNLASSEKVALFLMDYAGRNRLKILAHAEIKDLGQDEELRAKLTMPGYRARIERAFLFHLDAFDWNCPQHITPRFTEAELAQALIPIKTRLETLEAENASLREKLGQKG